MMDECPAYTFAPRGGQYAKRIESERVGLFKMIELRCQ